jgi:hypothetical protein
VPAQRRAHPRDDRRGHLRPREQRVLDVHGGRPDHGGGERPRGCERLVHDQVGPPPPGQVDDGVGDPVVRGPEQQAHHAGPRGARQLGAGDQRMAQHRAQRDPVEPEPRRDVLHRYAAGVGAQGVRA